ncbi:MAG: metallophosphoesterase [Solirubrobacterales bacterium]
MIAAAGDIACDPGSPHFGRGRGSPLHCRQRATSDLILRGRYRAVLALGDLQYRDGRLWKLRRSYGPTWGRFRSRTLPVLGNHEYGTVGARPYFRFFEGRGRRDGRAGIRGLGWYGRDLGRWHIVVLNSNCRRVGCGPRSRQVRWLRRNLGRHPDRCVLAAYHHPRYSSGRHEGDERVGTLWRVLYRAGVDVVLNGHDHDYERFAPQGTGGRLDRRRGVVEFVVGTGGQSLFRLGRPAPNSRVREDRRFGILRMRLGRGRYRWAFVRAPGGRRMDRGTRRCTPVGPLVRRYLRDHRRGGRGANASGGPPG